MTLYRLLRHVPAANVAALVLALVACAALAAEPSPALAPAPSTSRMQPTAPPSPAEEAVHTHDATPRETSWTPFIDAPMLPEYPSGHAILAGAVGAVLHLIVPH